MSNIIFKKDEHARRTKSALSLTGVNLAEALAVVHRKARAEAPAEARSYSVLYGYTDSAGKSVIGPTAYANFRVRYFTGAHEGHSRLSPAPRVRRHLVPLAAALAVACMIALTTVGALAQEGGTRNAERRVDDAGRHVDNVTYEINGWKRRVRRVQETVTGRRSGQQSRTPRPLPSPAAPARCQPPPAANSDGSRRPRRVCT
jgi:hypothetical protein